MKPLTPAAFRSNFPSALGGAVLLMVASFLSQPSSLGKPGPAPQQPQKLTASAIQVERSDAPDDLVIPEDTRVAMYENVILQLNKTKKFQHVYRSGDRRSKFNLLRETARSSVRKFLRARCASTEKTYAPPTTSPRRSLLQSTRLFEISAAKGVRGQDTNVGGVAPDH